MRIWKTGLAVGVLLAGGVMTAAQEEPAKVEKKPFTFKTSGETVEDFKIEFAANLEPDHSTAAGIVTSWAAYGDNRDSMKDETDVVSNAWSTAVANSMKKHEQKLLTEEAVKALHAEADLEGEEEGTEGGVEEEDEFSYVRQPLEVTGEKDEDGKHWVEAVQKAKIHELNYETEKWEDRIEEQNYRFETVKGEDGKWRINGIQIWEKDWENMDEEGNASYVWDDEMTMLAFIEASAKKNSEREAPPAPKQGTPEEAANSLFKSLIPNRDYLEGQIFNKGTKDWMDFLKAMVTKEFVENQVKMGAEMFAGSDSFEKAEDEREVESVTEKDGLTIVKYKKADEWMGAVEVHVKKVGEVWKVHKAGYYEAEWDMDGNETWKFVEASDVYSLSWR